MNKSKSIATILLSGLFIFGFTIWGGIAKDQEISKAERRKLEQKPTMSVKTILDRTYMEDLESYFLDQFPLRDDFRTLKASLKFDLLNQKDNNGIYLVEDSVFKIEYPLKVDQINYGADKINEIIDLYLKDSKIYYSIIPDKNYFVAEANGYPHLDYSHLEQIMNQKVKGKYIDIFDSLTIDNYYRTDAHWKQEDLVSLAEKLGKEMGLEKELIPVGGYEAITLEPFYGVYCGQSALQVEPDSLTYLTSKTIEAATVTGVEFEGELPVYTVEKFDGMDGYDIFLNGAQAILNINNPLAQVTKELIIFRDSFGSSISPLLLEGYSQITLIDLRYIATHLLEDYVDFHGQDVLFLYSTSLLNSSRLLK